MCLSGAPPRGAAGSLARLFCAEGAGPRLAARAGSRGSALVRGYRGGPGTALGLRNVRAGGLHNASITNNTINTDNFN